MEDRNRNIKKLRLEVVETTTETTPSIFDENVNLHESHFNDCSIVTDAPNDIENGNTEISNEECKMDIVTDEVNGDKNKIEEDGLKMTEVEDENNQDTDEDDQVTDEDEDEYDYGSGESYFDDDCGDIAEEEKPNIFEEVPKTYFTFDKLSFIKNAHETHKFQKDKTKPFSKAEFKRAYMRDLKVLQDGLPYGIWVKAYEDRIDLLSILIAGSENTPYEGSLFAFDIKLPSEYPEKSPVFHFIPFTKDSLNPNINSGSGKICLSLLGTWKGEHSCEVWSTHSSILQALISIQALILGPHPYFNEPLHDQDLNNPETVAKSKQYNESVTLAALHCMGAMLENPPFPWQHECITMIKAEIPRVTLRLQKWIKASIHFNSNNIYNSNHNDEMGLPQFHMLPFSRPNEIWEAVVMLKAKLANQCDK